jgi:hypothetical protein
MLKNTTAVGELRELLCALLPEYKTYRVVVRPEEQVRTLGLLRETLSQESFYFVFNLLTGELEHVNGVDKALGYSAKEFTVGRYLNCIHPGQAIQFNMIAHSMYKVLCKGVFKLHFFTNRYISLVGLRHYNGEYIVFKKTTSVFQYDDQNRLLAQLNEFTRIDVYENSPLKPRISEMTGLQKDEFERRVFAMTLQSFAEKKYFSRRQLEVLKLYANDDSVTTRDLAEKLGVEPSTINTYNKRILAKAKEIFTHSFAEAREVALYLKRERIIAG